MKKTKLISNLIYLLIIVLSLAILLLAACAPSAFLDTTVVYQGF